MARAKSSKTKTKKTTTRKSSPRRTTRSRKAEVQTMAATSESMKGSAHEADWRKRFFLPIVLILLAALGYLGIQQLVVATVNGSPISRIALMREMESQIGEQVLETLITKELVMQAARDMNIDISDEEIDAEISTIREQFEGSGQNFEDILALQGYTMERVREEVRMQKIIEKAIESDINITDEDIDAFIEENSAFLSEGQDTEDEAFRTDVREQLKQQQIGEAMQKWVADLKAQASINYFGSFARKEAPTPAPAIQVPEGEASIDTSDTSGAEE